MRKIKKKQQKIIRLRSLKRKNRPKSIAAKRRGKSHHNINLMVTEGYRHIFTYPSYKTKSKVRCYGFYSAKYDLIGVLLSALYYSIRHWKNIQSDDYIVFISFIIAHEEIHSSLEKIFPQKYYEWVAQLVELLLYEFDYDVMTFPFNNICIYTLFEIPLEEIESYFTTFQESPEVILEVIDLKQVHKWIIFNPKEIQK